MTDVLNLRKEQVVNIKKAAGIENQKAKVKLVLDFSGSMKSLYQDGTVDSILERLLPVAMAFDDDEKIDFYLFDTDCKYVGELGKDDIQDLAKRMLKKYSMGGTNYAPPILEVMKEFVAENPKNPAALPTYVMFLTDGTNYDKNETKKALIDASHYGIFFEFVGIGDANLDFLEKLDELSGRLIDNANFFQVSDIKRMSDEDLYKKLMGEFPTWLNEARNKGLLS